MRINMHENRAGSDADANLGLSHGLEEDSSVGAHRRAGRHGAGPACRCLGALELRSLLSSVAVSLLTSWLVMMTALHPARAGSQSTLRVEITWGHRAPTARAATLKLTGHDLEITDVKLEQAEAADDLRDGVARTTAGGGDIDGLSCVLRFAAMTIEPIKKPHAIWSYLLRHGDAGASQRLQADASFRPDPRKLTVQLDEQGTPGFSLTVDQLLTQKAFWLPDLDLFLSAGEPPVSFEHHQRALERTRGQRVLDRVEREPEATYAQYTARWEDMGSPAYQNPESVPPGHIVALTWDSALHKFGVDRFGGVRNDLGKLDTFELHFDFADQVKAWRGQKLAGGLPIIASTFEEAGVRYEIEQFAAPLLGPPAERRGDIAMVLLQKVTLTELEGTARPASVRLRIGRQAPGTVAPCAASDGFVLGDPSASSVWLAIQGTALDVKADTEGKKASVTVTCNLTPHGSREFIVKLPSPVVPADLGSTLLALDYTATRAATVKFWSDYLAQGAQFDVPEEAVNALFRANLWHALRLPRRHGAMGAQVKIDLPYSNFAYSQAGAPWPVNQAVYVDYMLYDLRGHHAIAAEELAVMYGTNQEENGHVGGFANWGVYTPAMLYAVAQHYLLSGDRASFERLLPPTLRALDWCLRELNRAVDGTNAPGRLMLAPLNDLSRDARAWAFNQAYFVAGLDMLGRALAEINHPRAAECRVAAQGLRAAVEREFAHASVRSPAVQLADLTWTPYVPCDAQASGRLFAVWYPTDVDTGSLHLSRLKALDPRGPLTTAMLHDHEDNLLIHQWGMINEPVYNQQATAYLLRDQPKPAIRAFYSMMACAFSHTVMEPVEHRWGWHQYFGPPSTDGAWFELYRNLLIGERRRRHAAPLPGQSPRMVGGWEADRRAARPDVSWADLVHDRKPGRARRNHSDHRAVQAQATRGNARAIPSSGGEADAVGFRQRCEMDRF